MKSKIVIVLCLAVFSTATFAQAKPEELIKFRQSAMMFMRWNIGMIKKQVVVKPQTYNQQQVSAAAHAIAAVANTNINALFSKGTETGKGWKATRVKAELFEQPDVVKKHLAALKKEANELARVADNGDVELIKSQFNHLFKACKSCHKDFRGKE